MWKKYITDGNFLKANFDPRIFDKKPMFALEIRIQF